MNKQSVIIYNFDILFNILNEVKENLKFNLMKIDKEKDILDIDKNKYENYLILTSESKNFPNKNINSHKILFLDNSSNLLYILFKINLSTLNGIIKIYSFP